MTRTTLALFGLVAGLVLFGLTAGRGQSPTPPADAAVSVTNKKTFQIPVEVKANRRAEIRKLQLWASRDKGDTWEIFDQQTNDKESLTFRDRGDGTYWVNMVTEYTDGRLDPPDVSRVVPAMKFFLDTVPPVVTVTSATRAGEEIAVEWTVTDQNPDDAVTKVYVRASGGTESQWQQAPAEAVKKGSARFKTTLTGAVVVMVTTADQARNVGSASKEVPAAMTVGYTPPPAERPARPTPPPAALSPSPAPALGTGPLPPPGEAGGPISPPALEPTPGPAPAPAPPTAVPPPPVSPPPVAPLPSQPKAAWPAEPFPENPVPTTPPPGPQPLATVGSGDRLPPPTARPAAKPPAAEVPTVQVIRTPRFDLGYQVDGGVSGVSKIVLYVTRDDGRSWRAWSNHSGKETPLKVVLDDPRLNREVEGEYGFKLVPVSGAGLSDTPPLPGTPPEMKVHVDVTPPTVDIYAPQADPANRNALSLIWKAADQNFGREPILIEYGETVNGPWKAVTTGDPTAAANGRLPNTGRYSWAIPPALTTPQVFLRVTAWDLGGNKTERVTERPILVDLTRPRATISGIVSPSNR